MTGHVFEKRYFSKLIDDDKGMLEVSRYIHLNPVEAHMVHAPEHYRWSSFYLYMYPHSICPRFMNKETLLQYFSGNQEEQQKKYVEFVREASYNSV